jgi:hypothetical protein
MPIKEETVTRYWSMVKRIASIHHRKFPMAELEDIEQEIWMWFVTHPNKVRDWSALPQKESDKIIARSLHNAALKFCISEKARIEKYSLDDLFWYSADFIKELLPSVLSEDWKRVDQKFSSGGPSGKSPAESGDWMAYASDISRAYTALNEEEKELVKRFYADDIGGEALMAESERPTARAAMMAANRAVHKMVKYLGGRNPLKIEKDFVENKEEKEEEENDSI